MKIESMTAINLSIEIVRAFLKKDFEFIKPFMDSRTFLIGPRAGQVMRNRMELSNAWIADHAMPDFSIDNIEASFIPTSAVSGEVIMNYMVHWHREDQTVMSHLQNLQVSWFVHQHVHAEGRQPVKEDYYKAAVFHVSNPLPQDERDLHYNTFGDLSTARISQSAADDQWIMIPGIGSVINRYPSGSILWIESNKQGHQSLVHTRDRSIRCVRPLSYFTSTYPDTFLAPSVSFIINPVFIKHIERFHVELWNSEVLTIPEKKYTAFKKNYEAYLKKKKSLPHQ